MTLESKRRKRRATERVSSRRDSESRHIGLAQSVFAKLVADAFSSLLTRLPPKSGAPLLAKAIHAYVEYADKPIRVRQGNREFHVPCLRVVEHTDLEVLDDTELERYVLPLIMLPDFRLLEGSIKILRKEAGRLGLEWMHARTVILGVANNLDQLGRKNGTIQQSILQVGSDASPLKTPRSPIRGERDTNVATRRTILRNLLRGGRRPTSKQVCDRWDKENVGVPSHWHERGVLTWMDAYRDPTCNVHKLISTDISRIRR